MYQRIKELCDKRGITIAELERDAGIGNGAIKEWENRYPRVDNLAMVAKVLKVSISTLVKTVDITEVEEKKRKEREAREKRKKEKEDGRLDD